MKEKTHEHKGKRGEERIVQNERKIPSEERKEKHSTGRKGNVYRSEMENINTCVMIERDSERWYLPGLEMGRPARWPGPARPNRFFSRAGRA
jgi:hypothetical protein